MKNLFTTITFLVTGMILTAQDPGDLFIDFGTAGIFKERWPGTITEANDIGILQDGSLVLTGYLETTMEEEEHILAMKLDDQGLPMEFGNSVYGFEYSFTGDEKAYAVQILPDDKILIAGYYYSEGHDRPFVIRLLPDGQPDEEFGDHGVFNGEVYNMDVMDIDIYQTGDSYCVVLCGQSGDITGRMLVLNDEGEVDHAFGDHGVIDLDTEGEGTFTRIDIDSENSCLYACAYYSEGAIITKHRFPGGELCPDFGDDGILIYGLSEGFSGKVNTIIHDPENNRIVLFGEYNHVEGDKDIFAYCLNADDGSPDPAFGVAGLSTLRSATSKDYLSAAIRQSDGKYYIGGYTNVAGDYDFFLGRLTTNGFADNTFGTNGLVLTDIGPREYINAIALSPNEDVLYAAGMAEETPGDDALMVTAYHTGYHTATNIELIPETGRCTLLFPNPSGGKVTIETGREGSYRVQVFDLAGNEYLRREFSSKRYVLDIEQLRSSVYLVKITTSGEHVSTLKLVKH